MNTRRRRTLVSLPFALVTLAVAACGSSTKATTPTTPTTPGAGATGVQPAQTTTARHALVGSRSPHRTFSVTLTGLGDSSPPKPASGSVTVRVDGATGRICWHFSKLVNVPHPIFAAIGELSSSPTVKLGAHFRPRGCTTDLADMPTILARGIYRGHVYHYLVTVTAKFGEAGGVGIALSGPLSS